MYRCLRLSNFFWIFLFAGIIIVNCTQKDKFEREFSFHRNLVNTKDPELVCQLLEKDVLLKNIVNFTILNDTSFVVVDGRVACLYHISGTFIKQFGNFGQAGGEMISPSLVYATSNFVYIWDTSMMKFVIFDHKANFKNEVLGFNRAVKKFVVNSTDEMLYLYTSGFIDNSGNKMIDVIDVYNIAEKSSKKYGERLPEDEVLSTFINSSGLYVDTERLLYLHPGNLIIHVLNLNSENIVRYNIDDKAFNTTKITSDLQDIMHNRSKLTDYLYKNSIVKGLYKDQDQFIIFSEIGQFDINEQTRVRNTQKRKVKLYIFDSSFNPDRTILFDYIPSPNIVFYFDAMYFLTTNLTDDDQVTTLNRFSLIEK